MMGFLEIAAACHMRKEGTTIPPFYSFLSANTLQYEHYRLAMVINNVLMCSTKKYLGTLAKVHIKDSRFMCVGLDTHNRLSCTIK